MKSKTNRSRLLAVVGGCAALALGGAALSKPGTTSPAPAVARGALLVHIGGCNHCHTPWVFEPKLGIPVPDMKRMLSGHPAGGPDPEGNRGKHDVALIGPTFTSFAMPFGTVYAPNLTPHKDRGLGSWTEKMFIDAFRKGKHMGGDGRAILPPMPWMDLAALPDADLKALFAYLRTIPESDNAVPDHKVPEAAYMAVTDNFEKLKKAMQEQKGSSP